MGILPKNETKLAHDLGETESFSKGGIESNVSEGEPDLFPLFPPSPSGRKEKQRDLEVAKV